MNGTEGADFYVPMLNNTGIVRSPYEYPQYYLASPAAYSFVAAYMFFLFIVAFPINILTIHVTLQSKKLRSPINFLQANVALANLFMVIGAFPTTIYSSMNGYFAIGRVGAIFEGFFCFICIIVSIWSVALMAMERMVIVCKPMGNFRFGENSSIMAVCFAWLMGCMASVPPLFGVSRYVGEGMQIIGGLDYYTRSTNEPYIMYLFACHIWVPVTIMVVCSACLICAGKESENTQGRSESVHVRNERETTRLSVIMVITFLVSIMPYAFTAWWLFTHRGHEYGPILMSVPSLYAKSYAIYNPIFYFWVNKQFRQCTISTLCCGKNPMEEEERSTSGHIHSSVSPA
ncbi:rhodopsin-like [Diretmus argenteus]